MYQYRLLKHSFGRFIKSFRNECEGRGEVLKEMAK